MPAGRAAPARGYMPHLDALRAVAVLAVLASHFWPSLPHASDLGQQGVNLFFVLSGFLITGILLDGRALVEDAGQSVGATMRAFYARRALRLLPLCYGTLLVAWALGVPAVRESLWWHVGYLSNVYFAITNAWHFPLGHLWSLAVEEQFYLAWPAVILLAPRRWLVPLVVAMIASAPVFRAVSLRVLGEAAIATGVLPFAKVDALGLGALLALSWPPGAARWPGWLRAAVLPAAAVALARLLPAAWTPFPLAWLYANGFWQTATAVVFAAVVLEASRGHAGVVGRLAAWAPLVYLGRISYGIYLLHLFVQYAADAAARRLGAAPPGSESVRFLVLSALTIAAAALSWHLFERPLNALKRHFPYRVRAERPPAALGVAPPIGTP